ncbi:CNNM domain-containing protein [Patescibacteria group bacterium]
MEYIIVIILIVFSAIFSGLTIGMLGLNKTELERKMKIGDRQAERIYSIRKNGNLLLVTLLLGNVAVNSVLSIFLGTLFSGVVAAIFATTLIVLFGEIAPQAVFYRHALSVGYRFVPVVRLFIFVLYPISYPISKILDKFLGEERETIWSKKEIKEIIKVHEDSDESDIDSEEENIVLGALSFSDRRVNEIMTPRNVSFMIEENDLLDTKHLNGIKRSGFSRIPVFQGSRDKIVGVLNVKSLIDLSNGKRVYDIYNRNKIFEIHEDEKLDELMSRFINTKTHMAYVMNDHHTFLGLVTMEDVIEEILRMEIVDETDTIKDMREESKKIA